ncbi:MAG: hypothetical protein JW974_00475 [Alphaproteobacteria bacterium]|nr:hypothetical protein [Alphaproteobacteria bacterium]MBN2675224.1 hypothetical protein [Alphaproteobacteria bacterium]
MSFNTFYINKSKKKELGVELELEGFSNNFSAKNDLPKNIQQKYIFDHIKDESVADDGTEIIFNHFPLNNWVPREIKKIYKIVSSFKLHAGETAGMHISYSGPNIHAIYDIHKRECEHIDKTRENGFITDLFQTIGARKGHFNGVFVYGTDYDVFEVAKKDDEIIEVRAFESTMNPDVFYFRLCITQYLLNYMAKNSYNDIPKRLFQDMPNHIKNIFWFLTITENPNKYGFKREFIYNQLFNNNLKTY